MNRIKVTTGFLVLAALSGCNQGTPGGPGATDAKSPQATYGPTENTFTLSVPLMSSTLQQGGSIPITVGIKRAKNFDQNVTLHVTDLPEGVTSDPAAPVIKHGDLEAKVVLQATDQAALGAYSVKVTGHPERGADAVVEFKLTIAPKDPFSLSPPRLSKSIKQGESQTLAIGIKRDKLFDKDVTLQFGKFPPGITVDPPAPVIQRGEAEATFVVTCADDAALGSFAIPLIGHPTQGADARSELKLTVTIK
jgi:hypothetical protein